MKTVMSPSASPGRDWLLYFHTMYHRPNCFIQLVFSPSFVKEKILTLRREEGAGITAAMAGGCSRELGWLARGHREGGGALRLTA